MNEELLKFNNGISGMLMRADLGDFDGNKLVIGGREINCQAFQLLDREKISAVFLFLLTCDEPERPDTASELKRSVERIAMLDHARRELAYRIVEGRVASAVVHIEGSMKTEPIAENLSPVFGPGYYGMDVLATIDICKALDSETIGVTVNEAGGMIPAASLCGVFFGLSDKMDKELSACKACRGNKDGCSVCPMKEEK